MKNYKHIGTCQKEELTQFRRQVFIGQGCIAINSLNAFNSKEEQLHIPEFGIT